MNPQSFLVLAVAYLFFLSLRDYMVTGVLAKGLPPDGRFHAYVLMTTGEVLCFATYTLISEPIPSYIGFLKFLTIIGCWVGGWLDFIYFVAKGAIPEWNMVWHWMPGKPTTTQWALWATGWLFTIIGLWTPVLLGMI